MLENAAVIRILLLDDRIQSQELPITEQHIIYKLLCFDKFYKLVCTKKKKNGWEQENMQDYNSRTVLDQPSSGVAAAVYVREGVDGWKIK